MTTVLRALFAFSFCASVLPAAAADFLVTNTGDAGEGSLRAAVLAAEAAAGDDTVTFSTALAGALIVLDSGPLAVASQERLTVSAESLAEPPEISAFGAGRLFEVAVGAELELSGLTLSEGFAPPGADGTSGETPADGGEGGKGGAILNEGRLVLRRCVVKDCAAGSGGAGGDKTGASGAPSGAGGKGGSGGAIASAGGRSSLFAEDCAFLRNNAGNGGTAGTLASGAAGAPGTGGPGGAGGAVHLVGGTAEMVRCRFESNRSGGGGVGGPDENAGAGGTGGPGGDGGGFAAEDAAITLTGCSFRSNAASNGGVGGDALSSADDTRGRGGRGGNGGGLSVRRFEASATPHLSASLFDANSAGNGQSGADSPSASAHPGTDGGDGGDGGGLYVAGNDGAVWRMENCTVHRNFAGIGGNGGDGHNGGGGGAGGDAGNGGGIAFSHEGSDYTAALVHVTVVSNEDGTAGLEGFSLGGGDGGGDGASGSGGGVWEFPGGINGAPGITLANSVVAANGATSVPNIASFTAEGNNLTSGDPGLGVLSDNGGPTLTVPPLFGGPLIDGGAALGSPPSTDQRGVARPFNGAPDLGAYEATLRPDLRIGTKSSPATHRVDGAYNGSGAGQTIHLKLSRMKTGKAFLSVENDGDIADDVKLTATRANRTVRLAAYQITGGERNVTARLAAGLAFDGLAPGGISLVRIEVRARSAKRPARQTIACTLRGSLARLLDVAKAEVSQAR